MGFKHNLLHYHRKDCCAGRLNNVEVRAGLSPGLNNKLVGTFKGPGTLGGEHVVQFDSNMVVSYITIQIVDPTTKNTLQVNGIKLNELPALGKFCGYIFWRGAMGEGDGVLNLSPLSLL